MTRNTRMTKKEKLNWLIDIAEGFRALDGRASKVVRTLLDDTDPQVRAEAVACLWNSSDPVWIEVLIEKALARREEGVRLDPLDDALELKAHDSAVVRARKTH